MPGAMHSCRRVFSQALRWIRMFGDVVFITGAGAIVWQVVILGLWRARQPMGEGVPASAGAGGAQILEQT